MSTNNLYFSRFYFHKQVYTLVFLPGPIISLKFNTKLSHSNKFKPIFSSLDATAFLSFPNATISKGRLPARFPDRDGVPLVLLSWFQNSTLSVKKRVLGAKD